MTIFYIFTISAIAYRPVKHVADYIHRDLKHINLPSFISITDSVSKFISQKLRKIGTFLNQTKIEKLHLFEFKGKKQNYSGEKDIFFTQ